MFLVGILSWWYGDGWLSRIEAMKYRLASSADFFSIGLLITTIFAPFRQISAGRVEGPIGVQVRAFFDRLVSRFIGALVRLAMIVVGSFALFFQAVFGIIMIALWPILPLFVVVGLILTVTGWVPQWGI
jgi:hypothetical protein